MSASPRRCLSEYTCYTQFVRSCIFFLQITCEVTVAQRLLDGSWPGVKPDMDKLKLAAYLMDGMRTKITKDGKEKKGGKEVGINLLLKPKSIEAALTDDQIGILMEIDETIRLPAEAMVPHAVSQRQASLTPPLIPSMKSRTDGVTSGHA